MLAGFLVAVNHRVVVPKDYPSQFGHFPGPDICNLLILLMRCIPVGTTRKCNPLILIGESRGFLLDLHDFCSFWAHFAQEIGGITGFNGLAVFLSGPEPPPN